MSMVCVGSVRGAPGASTLAVLAAACWPRPVALIEADPAGGALAVRYRLGRTPGLAGLAAVVRHGADEAALWQHAQMLPGDLPVVVAPESGEVTSTILRDAGPALAAWCGGLEDVDIIVDCGRIAVRDANWALCAGADETLVVARPRAEELYPAAHRLRAMADDVPSAGLVLIGDRPHSPSEITAQLGVPVRGVVADDSWAAGVLTVGGRSRGLRRSSLVRSVRSLVDDLMYRLETPILESGPRPAAALTAAAHNTGAGVPAIGMGSGHPSGPVPTVASSPPPPPSPVSPNLPPTRAPATTAAAAAAQSLAPAAAAGPRSTGDVPPISGSQPATGLPPTYLQRSREAKAARAAAATATITGPNRRVPSGQYPAVPAPPPSPHAAPRHAPPPPRPRTGPARPGAARPGAVPRPANPPVRQRPGGPGQSRWRRNR
jgi:hypothetical protein